MAQLSVSNTSEAKIWVVKHVVGIEGKYCAPFD